MLHALLIAVLAAAPGPAPSVGKALTLDDALALAGAQNLDLRLARLQGENADVDAYQSWAGVLPRLDLTMGFGRLYYGSQQQVITAPTSITQDPSTGKYVIAFEQQTVDIPGQGSNTFSLGLQLVQPVFDGLRGPRTLDRARLSVTAAARQVDETALTVAFDVTRRYYEVVKADRSIAVLEETVARSEQFLQSAEALFVAGRSPKSDTLAARVNLGSDRISLETQRARAALARADLAFALGTDPAQIGPLAPSADVDRDELALGEPPAAEAVLEKAQKSRPAFARAKTLIEQAQLDEKIATADQWPVVSAILNYNRNGPTFAGNDGVWGNPVRQFVASAQLQVAWNLFNGRQTLANEQRAAIATRTAQVQAEQLAVQVEGEVARARANVIALNRSVALSVENLKSAEEGVRLAQQRLEAGAATQLEVRDAALKLTQAKLTLVNARIDAIVARADLNRAAGGSL